MQDLNRKLYNSTVIYILLSLIMQHLSQIVNQQTFLHLVLFYRIRKNFSALDFLYIDIVFLMQ